MRQRIPIGVLYSRDCDYRILSRAAETGALAGIAAVNADRRRGIEFVAVSHDPGGKAEAYGASAAAMLRHGELRHIVGCVTSSSRKEVIPVLERQGAMLWYAAPYEGFEANEHVVYTHACPNQHLVPLLAYVLPRWGADVFLLGSNYVWGWELNRAARELVGDAGGRVLGERYLALGDTDVARLIGEIRATRPAFILNNLIGESSYAFLKAFQALGLEDDAFLSANCPVLSCDLMEPELAALDGAGEGHLVVGPYFAGGEGAASSMEAAAHASVLILADLIEAAGTDDPAMLRSLLENRSFPTPLGALKIDPQTQHTHLPVLVGRIEGERFTPVWQSETALRPDPYLSRYDPRLIRGAPALRIVS